MRMKEKVSDPSKLLQSMGRYHKGVFTGLLYCRTQIPEVEEAVLSSILCQVYRKLDGESGCIHDA